MDKIRTFFSVMWTQRFWVLTCTALLVSSLCWMMGSGALQEEFKKEKGEIESKFSAIQSIASNPVHGNEEINQVEAQEVLKLRKTVMTLWRQLYEQQREQVLKWPDMLGDDFIAELQDKQFGDRISRDKRERYLNYIENRFKGLLEIVGALDEVGETGPGARSGAGRISMEGMMGEMGGYEGGMMMGRNLGPVDTQEDYLVRWLDQAELAARMQFAKVPSSVQVWVTQEDLWVYETLLKVVSNVNAARGATRPDNTAVRAIMTLAVGRDAAVSGQQTQGILMPAGDAAGMGGMGGEMGMGGMGGEMGGEMGMGGMGGYDMMGRGGGYDEMMGGGMGQDDGGASLLSMRYLDDTDQPIDAADVEALPAQFRRLPMRMVLMMEPEWIPRVMVECANAPLPVEVTRVRVNPDMSGVGFETSAIGGGRGGMMGRGGPQMPRGLSGMMDLGGMGQGSVGKQLAQVEIHGVVFIYNQPDQDELPVVEGVEIEEESAAEEVASADGETNAG